MSDQRSKFEAWISAPPFERSLTRFPADERVAAWPGQYVDIEVETAWEAWQQARREMQEEEKCSVSSVQC